MNYTFRQVLTRPDRHGRCRVVLDVTWDWKREKLPTGVSCLPEHFQPTAKRVVSTKDPNSAVLNARLAAVVAKVEKAALTAEAAETAFEVPRAARKAAAPSPIRPQPKTAHDFLTRWEEENPHHRHYKQAYAHLEAYRPGWEVLNLTRADFSAYVAHAAALPLADSTILHHVKFLRECFRMAGQAVPKWLKHRARYGRAPALQAGELRQLMALPLWPDQDDALLVARDMFLLQVLLLLRDSDLRRLRPHHLSRYDLPGYPGQPLVGIYQDKTADELRLPLPPLGWAIWQRYAAGGQLPVGTQQYRNRHLKQLMERAGLTREFVRVRFYKGKPVEEVLPLWQAVTTHTARHSGADMVMLGSAGNSDLKELALGHSAVYGHDALERYGPALLAAWAAVLGEDDQLGANPKNAPRPASRR